MEGSEKMTVLPTEYPEHEKMKSVKDDSHKLGEFIEWMHLKEWGICTQVEGHGEGYEWIPSCWVQIPNKIEAILSEYFEIDLKILEEEKREMLRKMRKSLEQ